MIRPYLLSALVCLLAAGCQQPIAFEDSPAERTQRHIEAFREVLTSASHGWQMSYFPRVDSLLFRNPSLRLDWTDVTKEKYGYGGYLALMKFSPDRRLEIKADFSASEAQSAVQGEYDVRLGSSLQLSLTTYTPLHKLVTSELSGVSDFVYRYRDYQGRLIFTTGVSAEGNRPYIVLTPLKSEQEWQHTAEKALEHRRLFEKMVHPQITIRRGSRVFFQSDAPFKDPRGDLRLEQERNRKRYHIFLSLIEKYSPIFRGYNGIGSGYVGTGEGLSFRPGFQYDGKITFTDFEYRDGRFVAELVSVYNPERQRFHFESKHLYPDGEPTSYVAEIFDTHQP